MNYIRFGALLFFLIFSMSATGQEWTWHKLDDGSITVLVPGDMDYQQKHIETNVGRITQHHYFSRDTASASGNYLYHISYYDYPEGTIPADSADLRLLLMDLIVDGSVNDLNGTLKYAGDLEIRGLPSRIWKVAIGDGEKVVRNQLILQDDRIITMQVFTLAPKDKNRNIDKFMDSVKLADKT